MHRYVAGKPVLGDVGELVCTKPFPSMPTHFWNDNGGIKYKKAYFSHWPGENGHNCPFISLTSSAFCRFHMLRQGCLFHFLESAVGDNY